MVFTAKETDLLIAALRFAVQRGYFWQRADRAATDKLLERIKAS